ncbi:MAG: substrate-binding domain-containing protein, partial [Planctomycetes bacterium]|nr:substrate-binding domain-containing protein [Planctomycetota bacterium]
SLITGLFLISTFLGCGEKESGGADEELILLCGSSFASPCNELTEAFTKETGIKVISSFAGSEEFLPLVKTGGKGDILITHDPFLQYVKDAKRYQSHAAVGYVAPVLTVVPGNPKNIKSIEDLANPGIKVALSNPEYSTCGEMVEALLKKKGLYEKVMENVDSRLTKGHSTLGNYIKVKVVDAVIMWNGVANTFGDAVEVVKAPYEYEEEIGVHVMGLNNQDRAEDIQKFIDYTLKHGKGIFKKHGYNK